MRRAFGFQNMLIEKECVVCGNAFDNKRKDKYHLSPKQFGTRMYCSTKCVPNKYWLGKKNPGHAVRMREWIRKNGHPLKGKRTPKAVRIKQSIARHKGIMEGRITFWNKGKKYFLEGRLKKNVGYGGLHTWVESRLGVPRECWNCGIGDARKYEWCNMSKKYNRDLTDWIRLCTSCHRNYDYGNIKLSTVVLKHASSMRKHLHEQINSSLTRNSSGPTRSDGRD